MLIVVSHPLGGIRTYLLNNLPHIARAGYVYTFIAPAGKPFDEFKIDAQGWPDAEFVDIPVRNRKYSLFKGVWHALQTQRFHLIHTQGLRAGTEAALANLRFRVPHIMTLHDVIVPQNDIPGRFKWVKEFVVGKLTSRVDVVVPVSNDCAENHLQHFPCWRRGPCRIRVIPNGVDLPQLNTQCRDIPNLREQLGINPDVSLIGFFGRFMPQKGFTVLLDAIRLLADRGYRGKIRLVATDDPNGYGREYQREVQADPTLRDIVRFIAPVPRIAALMSQIDLLVMPSLWEAYGLLAAEAMVLGIPVVGSDAIGLREVLRGTPAMAPQAGSAIALANAIASSIQSPAKGIAEEFRPEAMRRFNNLQSASQLQSLYDDPRADELMGAYG